MKRNQLIIGLLTLVAVLTTSAIIIFPDNNLHLIACDVGQGDAILAIQGKTQILIDGGPNNKVIDCLSRHLPFWDREIEIVMLTHPEKDHYSGLIDVFKRYEVGRFLASGLEPGTSGYQVLEELVGGSGTQVVNPISGMVVGNSMIHLEIVHPTREYIAENTTDIDTSKVLGTYTSSDSPNDFSLVSILRYNNFDALLTGDITPKVMDKVTNMLEKSKAENEVEYIKVPHHGSKNGLTQDLLKLVNPKVAIISVGKNQWGHPHQEILDMLNEKKIRILRTDQMGDVEIISDGDKWWIKK